MSNEEALKDLLLHKDSPVFGIRVFKENDSYVIALVVDGWYGSKELAQLGVEYWQGILDELLTPRA